MNNYLSKSLTYDSFDENKRRMGDVTECLVVTKGEKDEVKIANLILSLLFSVKLAVLGVDLADADEIAKFVKHEGDDDKNDIYLHKTLNNAFTLSFTKRNIIPFLVRINLLLVKNEKLFNTILEVFRLVENSKDAAVDSNKIMMKRDRENYLGYLEAVSKGGKVLTGAIISNTIATSTADEADLSLFIDNWTTEEKAKLGIHLVNNGNRMRQQKGTYEVSVDDEVLGGQKTVLIKFPRESEEISARDFTYPRAAIVTARDVAKKCCVLDKSNGIKMSALALNIGWHGLFVPENVERISKVFVAQGLQTVTPDMLFLCTIPRIRPHKYLELEKSESYLMVIFYIINDVIISLKNGKDRFDFTADTISKLKKTGFTVESRILKKTFAVIWNVTRHVTKFKSARM